MNEASYSPMSNPTNRREQDVAHVIIAQIKSAWVDADVPPIELLLQEVPAPDRNRLDSDSIEILDNFSGKPVGQLPFGDNAFDNLSPFDYFSSTARKYYISAYMIHCLDLFLDGNNNPCKAGGMDTIVTFSALLNADDKWKITGLTQAQKLAVKAFLEFAYRHAKFFLCEDLRPQIKAYLKRLCQVAPG